MPDDDRPRQPPGRPPLENPRTVVVRFRVNRAELVQLERAAAVAGVPVGDYARTRALSAARRARSL